MINKKEDLIGTIFNIANDEGDANVRLAGMFYDVCTKYEIRVMGGNGRDYFMKAVGEGLVNLCIADDDGLGAFGRVSVSKDSEYGSRSHSMSNFRNIDESELKSHLEEPTLQPKEAEWVNGDECRYANDINQQYIYIGEHPYSDGHYVFSEEKGITYIANGYLLEPESPEDKAKRERLEAAYDLYLTRHLDVNAPYRHEEFLKNKSTLNGFLAIVDKTNYRCTTSS